MAKGMAAIGPNKSYGTMKKSDEALVVGKFKKSNILYILLATGGLAALVFFILNIINQMKGGFCQYSGTMETSMAPASPIASNPISCFGSDLLLKPGSLVTFGEDCIDRNGTQLGDITVPERGKSVSYTVRSRSIFLQPCDAEIDIRSGMLLIPK